MTSTNHTPPSEGIANPLRRTLRVYHRNGDPLDVTHDPGATWKDIKSDLRSQYSFIGIQFDLFADAPESRKLKPKDPVGNTTQIFMRISPSKKQGGHEWMCTSISKFPADTPYYLLKVRSVCQQPSDRTCTTCDTNNMVCCGTCYSDGHTCRHCYQKQMINHQMIDQQIRSLLDQSDVFSMVLDDGTGLRYTNEDLCNILYSKPAICLACNPPPAEGFKLVFVRSYVSNECGLCYVPEAYPTR